MIDGNRAATEEDQRKRQRRQGKRKFVSVIAGESVVPVHLPYGDNEVDADGEGSGAREKSGQNQQPAEKLRE